jgi:hypothetical protein
MELNDPFDQCQPNPRAFTGRVQFVEQSKNALMVFGRYAHAVVAHEENEMTQRIAPVAADLDLGFLLIAHVFGGVVEQVLDDLCQTHPIYMDSGQVRLSMKRDTAAFKPAVVNLLCIPYQLP